MAGATGLEPAASGVTGRRNSNDFNARFDSATPRVETLGEGKSDTKARPVAQCLGCGLLTAERRAVTCCKGYCYDPSGKSCNSWPCPSCGRHHYWTCSFAAPAGAALDVPLYPRAESPTSGRLRARNLPQGTSDYDVYRMNVVADSAVSSLLARRIEQGIGRGTRGGGDYCAVVLIGSKLVGWIGRCRG